MPASMKEKKLSIMSGNGCQHKIIHMLEND